MAETVSVEILLKGKNEVSKLVQEALTDVEAFQKAVENLQATGKDRTIEQELLFGILKGLGLVNKEAEKTKGRLVELNDAFKKQPAGGGALNPFIQKIKDLGAAALRVIGPLALAGAGVTGLAAAARTAVTSASDLEHTLTRATLSARDQTITIEELRRAVAATANTYGESFNEIAGLYQQVLPLAKNLADAQAAVNAAVQVGTVTGQSFQSALSGIITLSQAFGRDLGDAGETMETFIGVSQRSRIPLQQLAQVMGFMGPIAQDLGIGMKDLAASVEALAAAGFRGIRGTRALQGILFKLQSPSKELENTIKLLGFNSVETAIQTEGLSGVLVKLRQAVGDDEEALTKLIGRGPALAAFNALTANGGQRVADALAAQSKEVGSLLTKTDAVEKTLAQTFEDLQNAVKNALTTVGEAFIAALKATAAALTQVVLAVQQVVFEVPRMTKVVVDFVAAIPGVSTAVDGITGAFNKLPESVRTAGETLIRFGVIAAITQGALGPFLDKLAKAREETNKLKKAEEELRATNKEVEKSVREGFNIKPIEELNKLKQEQLDLYREEVKALISVAEKQLVVSTLQGASQEVLKAQGDALTALKGSLLDVDQAQKIVTKSTGDQAAVLKETNASLARAGEEAKAYAEQVRNATKLDFDAAVAELNRLEDETVKSLTLKGKESDIQAAQKSFGERRIALAEEQSKVLIAVANKEADEQLKSARRRFDISKDTPAFAKDQVGIQIAMNTEILKADQLVVAALKAEREKVVANHKASVDRIKALEKGLADFKRTAAQEERDILREGLGARQKAEDAAFEIAQINAQIQEAINKKDLETAIALAERKKKLAQDVGGQIEEKGKVIQTAEQGQANRLAVVQGANQDILAIKTLQLAEEKKIEASTRAQAQDLTTRLASAEAFLTKLATTNAQLIDPKNLDRVEAVIKQTEALKDKEVKVKFVPVVDDLVRAINALQAGDLTIPVHLTPSGQAATGGAPTGSEFGGRFSTRGAVAGPGTTTSDSVPIMASRGEFVMKADAVRRWGSGFMQWLNSYSPRVSSPARALAGRTHFATGGLVGAGGGGAQAPVNLTVPGLGTFPMSAGQDVVANLTRAVRMANMKRRRS